MSSLAVQQNLKQQRSRREQFSQPPSSSSPMMANNFSKSLHTHTHTASLSNHAPHTFIPAATAVLAGTQLCLKKILHIFACLL